MSKLTGLAVYAVTSELVFTSKVYVLPLSAYFCMQDVALFCCNRFAVIAAATVGLPSSEPPVIGNGSSSSVMFCLHGATFYRSRAGMEIVVATVYCRYAKHRDARVLLQQTDGRCGIVSCGEALW